MYVGFLLAAVIVMLESMNSKMIENKKA
jgi:hypothetical protein